MANDIRRGMPTQYDGRRATMEEMAKTALGATTIILFVETTAITQSPTWEDMHTVASKITLEGRFANLVYLKELHKATKLTKVSQGKSPMELTPLQQLREDLRSHVSRRVNVPPRHQNWRKWNYP